MITARYGTTAGLVGGDRDEIGADTPFELPMSFALREGGSHMILAGIGDGLAMGR